MKKRLSKGIMVLFALLAMQFMLTSCEEDSEIFDNMEQYTDEQGEQRKKPR